MSRRCGRLAPAATTLAAFFVFESTAVARGAAQGTGGTDLQPAIQRALSAAVAGAQRRLSRPGCQRVFSEFYDAAGVPLAEKLDAMGLTAGDHLATLVFADGAGRPACRTSDVLAITSPGSGTVRVCGSRFRMWQQLDPPLAEAIIIHELLHTLGLGEDPPSSQEITRRVVKRCGR
jgi:hypothetical protein